MKSWRISLKTSRKEKRLNRRLLAVIVLASIILGITFSYIRISSSDTRYIINTSHKLEQLIKTDKPVAVMFASPSCPVCEKMLPQWLKLAKQNDKRDVKFYLIELGDKTVEAFYRYDIKSTPTYILFYKGNIIARHVGEFQGQNISQAMLEWSTSSLIHSHPLTSNSAQTNTTCTGNYCKVETFQSDTEMSSNSPLAFMIAASFLAGILASLSPCTLPLLIAHATLSAKTKNKGSRIVGGCFIASTVSVLLLGALFAVFSWFLSTIQSFLTPFIASLLTLLGLAGVAGYRLDLPAAFSSNNIGIYGRCGLFGFLSVQCNLPLVLGPFLLIVRFLT